MQIFAVNEDSCHTSTSTSTSTPKLTSSASTTTTTTTTTRRKMTNCQQLLQQQQSHQQCKSKQTFDHCVNKLSFQFRIVVMPHRLQMRLRLPPATFLASLLFLQLLIVTSPVCQAVGYSYTRFSGPVTGPEQKIIVHDGSVGGGGIGGGGGTRIDFIAKPAYEFAYGVEDAQARLLQNRQETRDGDAVHGSYSVVDPDGNLRVVKYTADHINGFQAEVTTNGLHTAVHGQLSMPQNTVQTHPTPTPLWYFPHPVQQQVQHPNTQGTEKGSHGEKGRGNYKVNDDYEETGDSGEERQERHKATNAESEENYEDEDEDADEHEDYDNSKHSGKGSKETSSYEEHSEEYY